MFFPFSIPARYRLANYKALVEHQEQQLRKLKEELRRAQQEQDATGKFKINIGDSSMLNISFKVISLKFRSRCRPFTSKGMGRLGLVT